MQGGTLRLTQPRSGSLEEWPLQAEVGAAGLSKYRSPSLCQAGHSACPELPTVPRTQETRPCPAPQPEAAHRGDRCRPPSSNPQCEHCLSVSLEAQGLLSMRQPGLVPPG